MKRRNWKKVYPSTLRQAFELCLAHAKEKENLSIERVADRMGIESHWTLYKWLENGRMPAVQIRAFEHACGIDLVTQFFATSAHRLLIEIPRGALASEEDLLAMQGRLNDCVQSLVKFYKGDLPAEVTLESITAAMTDLAGHRSNVVKAMQPEIDLFGGEA